MSGTLERLLDAAEDQIRLKGFHAVSFRDLAEELSIKSSSVHYYFKQKQDLGVALVDRYNRNFFEVLDDRAADAESFEDKLKAFCSVYTSAFDTKDRMCLCGVLGAESAGLPEDLSSSIATFFNSNIQWLRDAQDQAIEKDLRLQNATHIVASLQGGMMIANTLSDPAALNSVIVSLLNAFKQS